MQEASTVSTLLTGKQLLIFDLDGTIADTSSLHASAFEQVLRPLGIRVDYPSIAGMKTADALTLCAQSCGFDLSREELEYLVLDKQKLVRAMMKTDLQPLPGADRFLRWARGRFRLSMATSGSWGSVSVALAKLGYSDWFDPLVCAEDVELAKPSPAAFKKVLDMTGCPAQLALIFEDSAAGMLAAQRAGVAVVHIGPHTWEAIMEKLQ